MCSVFLTKEPSQNAKKSINLLTGLLAKVDVLNEKSTDVPLKPLLKEKYAPKNAQMIFARSPFTKKFSAILDQEKQAILEKEEQQSNKHLFLS